MTVQCATTKIKRERKKADAPAYLSFAGHTLDSVVFVMLLLKS